MANPLDDIRSGPMNGFQISAVAICLTINFLDGFDILAIAFAAPQIASGWNVSQSALGGIFSAGLIGMFAGAFVLSPLADIFGRRPLIVVALTIITIGMLASAATTGIWQLVAARFLTGLGVGGMLSSLTTIVAEYASDRRRHLAISILQSGYPVGAVIAGFTAAWLLDSHGWRSIFAIGGVLSGAMIPLVLWRLPESVAFLSTRRPPGALDKVNAILTRLGRAQVDTLPAVEKSVSRGKLTDMFRSHYLPRTLAIWIAFMVMFGAFYFVTSWTPKILVDAGLSSEAGISGGVLLAIGGVVGSLIIGALSTRLSIHVLGAVMMACGIVAMFVFGRLEFDLGTMLPTAFAIGFFTAAAIISLYAILPDLYPAAIRNSGTGWALGVGRFGAVFTPWAAGILIDAGWERADYYAAFALPMLVSLAAILYLRRHNEHYQGTDATRQVRHQHSRCLCCTGDGTHRIKSSLPRTDPSPLS